jgi:rRNA maturation protein Nop10
MERMNINNCPHCGAFYTTHNTCPHCGKPTVAQNAATARRKHRRKYQTALDVKTALDREFQLSQKDKLTYDFLYLIDQRNPVWLSEMTPEFIFDERPTKRLWRVDFVIKDLRIAIELEGGVWTGGRHTRGSGFIEDCDKYNELALQGWLLLRFTRDHIDKEAVKVIGKITRAIEVREEINKLLDVA